MGTRAVITQPQVANNSSLNVSVGMNGRNLMRERGDGREHGGDGNSRHNEPPQRVQAYQPSKSESS